MTTRSYRSWQLTLAGALFAVAVALPWHSAAASPLAFSHASPTPSDQHQPHDADWLSRLDARTAPFVSAIDFAAPDEAEPRFSLEYYEEHEPVMLIMPWTFFAISGVDVPYASGYEAGILAEVGVELGTPLFHVGGVFPLLTVAPAIGGQIHPGEPRNHGAFHFSVNSLMGLAVANPSGTNIFQFGMMLRGEIAFRRLRYNTGEDILGIDGLGAVSVGMFVRYSFLMDWDLAGSAAMFVTFDVTEGRREWLVGVDFGGLIVAVLLNALSD